MYHAVPMAVQMTLLITVPMTVPMTVPTAVPTAVPMTVPTPVPTAVPMTVPMTVPTAVPITVTMAGCTTEDLCGERNPKICFCCNYFKNYIVIYLYYTIHNTFPFVILCSNLSQNVIYLKPNK